MKCPSCAQSIHQGAERCPHCGFHSQDLEEVFFSEGRALERIDDGQGIFSLRQKRRLQRFIYRLERQFRPCYFLLASVGLPAGQDLRGWGIWRLNRGYYPFIEEEAMKAHMLLMSIDPVHKHCVISVGYALEAYLDEGEGFKLLSAGHPYFLQGDYAQGCYKVLKQIQSLLRAKALHAPPHASIDSDSLIPLIERIRQSNPSGMP